MRRKRNDQDVGACASEAVDVALERPVDEHVACLHAMTAGVTSLGVAAAQDDGCEAVRVLVPREDFVRRMVRTIHPAWVR